MKFIITAALLFLTPLGQDPFSFAQDAGAPVLVERTDLVIERVSSTGIARREVAFIERSTMRREGDLVDVWVLIGFSEPHNLPSGFEIDGIWSSRRFDCAAGTVAQHAYAGLRPDGSTLLRNNDRETASPVVPGSNLADVADIVCGRVPRTASPLFRSAREAVASARIS